MCIAELPFVLVLTCLGALTTAPGAFFPASEELTTVMTLIQHSPLTHRLRSTIRIKNRIENDFHFRQKVV
jgi:hypothetical protein